MLKHITESLLVVMGKIHSWEAVAHSSNCEQGNIFNLSPTTHIISFSRKAVGLSTYSHCGFPKLNTADIQRERLITCEPETGMGNIYFMVLKEACTRGRQLILWCCQVKQIWGFYWPKAVFRMQIGAVASNCLFRTIMLSHILFHSN